MQGEKLVALVQRHRVGIHLAQIFESDPRGRDQVMHDADIGFRGDSNIEMEQMIVILVNRSGEGILHRYHRRIDLSRAQGYENGLERRVGNYFGLRTQKLVRSLLAESPQFALEP